MERWVNGLSALITENSVVQLLNSLIACDAVVWYGTVWYGTKANPELKASKQLWQREQCIFLISPF